MLFLVGFELERNTKWLIGWIDSWTQRTKLRVEGVAFVEMIAVVQKMWEAASDVLVGIVDNLWMRWSSLVFVEFWRGWGVRRRWWERCERRWWHRGVLLIKHWSCRSAHKFATMCLKFMSPPMCRHLPQSKQQICASPSLPQAQMWFFFRDLMYFLRFVLKYAKNV